MGFKDLALLNDALLAKQAGRLLHNKVLYSIGFLNPSFSPQLFNLGGPEINFLHMLGAVS